MNKPRLPPQIPVPLPILDSSIARSLAKLSTTIASEEFEDCNDLGRVAFASQEFGGDLARPLTDRRLDTPSGIPLGAQLRYVLVERARLPAFVGGWALRHEG